MSTKLISAVIIVVFLWIVWAGYQHWVGISSEQGKSQQQVEEEARAAAAHFDPRSLAGMPANIKDQLENTLDKAKDSAPGLREWLKTYQKFVEDPRLAWIQLDYVVLVSQSDPKEAKKVFHEVQERISPTSPVYPRLKQLEKTYQ